MSQDLELITKLIRCQIWVEQKTAKSLEQNNGKSGRVYDFAYPSLNKLFIINTDASNYAMRGIMKQDEKVISCFSNKFNKAQMKYPTTEHELIVIAEALKYHHNIIRGWEITIKMDHKNLSHGTAHHKSQHVLCQQLLIGQESKAKIKYYEGSLNLGAYGLSRIEHIDN